MFKDLINAVLESLEKDHEAIGEVYAELEETRAAIASRRYSDEVIARELTPKARELERRIADMRTDAVGRAQAIVQDWAEEREAQDVLDPKELTDDAKLLTGGFPLEVADLMAILERTSGNRTMELLTVRYADDHGISLQGAHELRRGRYRQDAANLTSALGYTRDYLGKPTGWATIQRMFTV